MDVALVLGLAFVLFWLIPMVLASRIATRKGHSGFAGLALGFFLGWIGVGVAALMSNTPAVLALRKTD